jgi:RNA polymerase sigma-70 factor, ECF subfamily
VTDHRSQPNRTPVAGAPSLSALRGRDESLRNRIAARDEQALVELVDLTTPWLLGVAHGMLHDADEAEEVVMETFRTVWASLGPATEESRGVDRAMVPPVEPNEAAQPGWQVHAQVHSALRALPEEQQAAVQLAYFEGLSQSEIAGTLGIPLGTVKTRLRLAFRELRSTLAHLKDWVL